MAPAPSSDGTEDDLSRQVVLALGFAGAVLDDIESATDGTLGRIAQKVVAETAMLLYAVAPLRATHAAVETASARLASRLVPLARGTEVQAAVCLDPGKALDHAMAHILLDRLGHADAAFDTLLQGAQQTGRELGPERLPHRLIEQAWLEQIWPHGAPSRRRRSEAVAASALGRPLDALKAARADIYAFTHAVLYASDMGRRPLASARRRRDIEADALVALGFALDAEDCDLTVEVLWTWPMLGLRWHPAALFALKGLIERQDVAGLPARHRVRCPACRRNVARTTRTPRAGDLLPHRLRDGIPMCRRVAAGPVATAGVASREAWHEPGRRRRPARPSARGHSIIRNGAPAWPDKAPRCRTPRRRCCCRSC